MIHKDIRIPFEIEDRRYEAVGFLDENEKFVTGDVVLARTAGENNGAVTDEDALFIKDHVRLLAAELSEYHLVTNQREPGNSRSIMIFCSHGCHDGRWWDFWNSLDRWWHSDELVVRRLP